MRSEGRLRYVLIALFLLLTSGGEWLGGHAASPEAPRLLAHLDEPPGPDRYTAITVPYTEYTWWMARWEDKEVVCEVVVDHEGLPTPSDIYLDCGEDLYWEWLDQQPCPKETLRKNPSLCEGYYLQYISSAPAEREVPVALPPPMVWLSLEDCVGAPVSATNVCEYIPKLLLRGEEPLPDEHILSIEGTFDGEPFTCGPVCTFELKPTDEDGVVLEFWAYSSYGDSSEKFEARIRVSEMEAPAPEVSAWYVDVLSTQWLGQPAASCAETWEVFPPVGGPPAWLTSPASGDDLQSEVPYTYLAANLILRGVVDASTCPDGGLLPGEGASPCGMDVARPLVMVWQNSFNALILDVAREVGVPARLLKNLFARESQFWPGTYPDVTDEVGLGQLTVGGADTALLWNPSFFEEFCPLVLEERRCKRGYLRLNETEQEQLRDALVRSVNAFCEDCPVGLDLEQVRFSVQVFAHTLLANCEQTGRIVRNVTRQAPGEVSTYEDLWKFTLVNYNAGPGCLSDAVEATWDAERSLTWEALSEHLEGVCRAAVRYVDDVSRLER